MQILQLLIVCCRKKDFPVFLFKILNTASDQVQNLTIGRPAFIFGNIVQFVMQLWVNFNTQVLILLVSHTDLLKYT